MARLSTILGNEKLNENKKSQDFSDTEKLSEALHTLIEMVEEDSLTNEEMETIQEDIEIIFNSILEESEDLDDTEEEELDEAITFEDFKECYGSTFIDDEVEDLWEKYKEDPETFKESLKGQMLVDYIEDNELTEGMVLKKTSMKKRRQSKKYARSAAGKKARKLAAKKRRRFANKIKRCAGKGKTFSFKSMTCTRKKRRR